jgi:hypothetical protein
MRRRWTLRLLLALLASAALGAVAPAVDRLAVELDRGAITVGDPVAVVVRWSAPATLAGRPARLLLGERWGAATVLEPPRLERVESAGTTVLSWRFPVTAFRTGSFELPPLEASLDGDPPALLRSSGGHALEVRSVLPAGPAPPPMPPAPPRPLPVPAAFAWTAAAFVAAVAAAALALARGHRPAAVTTPATPPLAELEQALAALGGAEPGRGHARLSHALRRFLARRLEFPAVAWTTTEIARRLARAGLDPEPARRATRVLRACDGVKFARRPASVDELAARTAEALAAARELDGALAAAAAETAAP